MKVNNIIKLVVYKHFSRNCYYIRCCFTVVVLLEFKMMSSCDVPAAVNMSTFFLNMFLTNRMEALFITGKSLVNLQTALLAC